MAAKTFMVQSSFLATFITVTSFIFYQINLEQYDSYMDEIFHIPQAQNYCEGNFYHWNDKITTLPGLYLSSQLFLKILAILSGEMVSSICTVQILRCINVFFITFCFLLIGNILYKNATKKKKMEKQNQENQIYPALLFKLQVCAIIYTSFPVLYFFSFMYYTDVGSTFFVLFSYYLSLEEHYNISALIGAVAVLFRQTNIVWIGFIAANSCINYLENQNAFEERSSLLQDVKSALYGVLKHLKPLLLLTFPYMMLLIGFIVFIVVNNGIVVGDRSNHEACLNFPQLFYFSATTLIFSCHLLLQYMNIKTFICVKRTLLSPKRLLLCVVVLWLMLSFIHHFTYVHKYLISDNRHYTFYVWRKVINRSWCSRYVLVIVYYVSWVIIHDELRKRNRHIWVLLLFTFTAVALVPQKLLEFRYYILPYLFIKLHLDEPSYNQLFVEAVVYLIVNFFTIYMFLYRSFSWENVSDVQRFMW